MKEYLRRVYQYIIRITISCHFSAVSVACFDPIEQYDLGLFTIQDITFYPAYLHLLFVSALFCLVSKQIRLNVLGYIHYRLYKFLQNVYVSVFGFERQLLFPYFYYIFIFILLSNLTGMLP